MPRPVLPQEMIDRIAFSRGQLSWIPFPEDYTISLGYGELRSQYLKLYRQMEQAESAYGEYKDMKYEDARSQMKEFLMKHGLVPRYPERFQFFIDELADYKFVPQLAYDAIYANMRKIDQIDASLYKDNKIIDLVLKYPKILGYLILNTPEKIAFKEHLKTLVPLRKTRKVSDQTGNIGSKAWDKIESYLGGKNSKVKYAKNTQSRRRKIPRSRKMLSRT